MLASVCCIHLHVLSLTMCFLSVASCIQLFDKHCPLWTMALILNWNSYTVDRKQWVSRHFSFTPSGSVSERPWPPYTNTHSVRFRYSHVSFHPLAWFRPSRADRFLLLRFIACTVRSQGANNNWCCDCWFWEIEDFWWGEVICQGRVRRAGRRFWCRSNTWLGVWWRLGQLAGEKTSTNRNQEFWCCRQLRWNRYLAKLHETNACFPNGSVASLCLFHELIV